MRDRRGWQRLWLVPAICALWLGLPFVSLAGAQPDLAPEELDAAISALASPEAEQRTRGAERLLAAEDSEEVLARLSGVLADAGATKRQQVEAVRLLGRLGEPGAVPVLVSVAGDEERGDLRASAILALARYDKPEARQAIASLLPEVRDQETVLAAALFAVEKQRIVEALPVLAVLVEHWERSSEMAILAIHSGQALLGASETEQTNAENTEGAELFLATLEAVLEEAEAPRNVTYAAAFALGNRQDAAAMPTLIQVIVEGLAAPETETDETEEGEPQENDEAAEESKEDVSLEERNHLLAQRAARTLGQYPVVDGELDIYPHVLHGVVISPSTHLYTERQRDAFLTFSVTAGAEVLPRLVGTLEPQPADEGQRRQTQAARHAIRALLDDDTEALLTLDPRFLEAEKLVALLEILEDFAAREAVDFVAPILHPRGPEAHQFSPEVRLAALDLLERTVERVHEAQAALQDDGLSQAERQELTARRDAAWRMIEPRDAAVDNPSIMQLVIERLGDEAAVADEEGNIVALVRERALDVLAAYEDRLDQPALVQGGALSDALQRRLVAERDPALLARAADIYIRATDDAQAAVHIVGLLDRVHEPTSRQNLYNAIQRLSPDVGEVHRIVTAAAQDLREPETELETRLLAAEVLRWSQTRQAIEVLGEVLGDSDVPLSLRHRLAEELAGLEGMLAQYADVVHQTVQNLYRDYAEAADETERELIEEPLRDMLGSLRHLQPADALDGLRPFLTPREDRLDVLALREVRFIITDREVANEIVPELLTHLAEMEGNAALAAVVRVLEDSWGLPARRIIQRLEPHLGHASYLHEGLTVLGEADLDARMQARVSRAMIQLAREADQQIARRAVRLVGEMTQYPAGASLLRRVYRERPELRDEITTVAQRLAPGWQPPEVD